MNITIKDYVGLPPEDNLKLARSLLENRKPEDGSLDYGFETHGALGIVFGIKLPYPVQVFQSNKRKTEKSPIVITIEKHTPLF